MSTPELSPTALALGRIPTGLYIVSTRVEGQPLAFVGSFVMQVGFEPPTLCVAIGRERDHLEAIRSAGSFAVSILDGASAKLMGAFFKPYGEGESAFDHVACQDASSGAPVLTEALAWLDCRHAGEYDGGGDHVVVFGTVEAAELLREGDPSTHLRKNGLGY